MKRALVAASALATLLTLGSVASLDAQTPGAPQTRSAEPGLGWAPGWGPGPMMGGGSGMMGRWEGHRGSMMGGRGPGRRAMMGGPAEFIDGRIAFLRAELKITDQQKPLFDAYAAALRTTAGTMQAMHERMWSRDLPDPMPERLQWHIDAVTSRLEALKAVKVAVVPLYEALSKEQKETADDLMSPMGLM